MKKLIHIGKKGQAMSYDLIVAGFLMLLIIAISIATLQNQKIIRDDEDTLHQMHLTAVNTFNTILTDQNCSNGGIVNEKRVLSLEKISCFNSTDYNTLRQNLSIEQYDFYLKIYDNNSTLLEKGVTGIKRAVAIQRVAMLKNSAKKGVFILYEK